MSTAMELRTPTWGMAPEPARPLDWLAARTEIAMVGWDAPVDEGAAGVAGHDPRSEYVERFWLPLVGPSCLLASRHLTGRLGGRASGVVLSLDELAGSLGLGAGTGRNATVRRTLARLIDFGLARVERDAFELRRAFPSLTACQVGRLPLHLAVEHRCLARFDRPTDRIAG